MAKLDIPFLLMLMLSVWVNNLEGAPGVIPQHLIDGAKNYRGQSQREFESTGRLVQAIRQQSAINHGLSLPSNRDDSGLLGDIALSQEQACEMLAEMGGPHLTILHRECSTRKKRNVADVYKWNENVTINYAVAMRTTLGQKAAREAIKHWEENTCLDFEEVSTTSTKQHLYFHASSRYPGCWSYVGKTSYLQQQISLSTGCTEFPGISIHEVGHAIGLFHQQSRPDRDQYVTLNLNVVNPDAASNFDKRSWANTYGTPYDYGSVMHYGGGDFCQSCQYGQGVITAKEPYANDAMGNRVSTSFLDLLIVNKAYNCHKKGDCAGKDPKCLNGGFPDYNSKCDKCVCPEGLGGDRCDEVAKGDCPGDRELHATPAEKCISNPYNPSQNQKARCSWNITASFGSVYIRFAGSMNLYHTSRNNVPACQNYVEIKNSTNLAKRGMRFCGVTTPSFPGGYLNTKSSDILVHYSSEMALRTSGDGVITKPGTFTMCYKAEGSICDSSPCKNNGRCRTEDNQSFQCDCTNTGYIGSTCEEPISSQCALNPCKNGGICSPDGNSYTCDCSKTDYIGTNCDTQSVCSTNPCKNGGVCQSSDGIYYSCDCSGIPYSGPDCGTYVNPCQPDPCYWGTCLAQQDGSFKCRCFWFSAGSLCQNFIWG